MNYCSISDAWGTKNNNIENFQPHNNIENFQPHNNIENFHSYNNINTNTNNDNNNDNDNNDTIEYFKPLNNKKYTKVKNKMSCDEILEHIQNCRHCNEILRLKYNFNSNSNSNFIQNLTQNNKDTCILILVAIFVYLFFKLLNKI
jgi:hypothetical protein